MAFVPTRLLAVFCSAALLLVGACDSAGTSAGCSEGGGTCYRYQAFDAEEVLAVEGALFLSDDAPPGDLAGSWVFDRVGPGGVGPQVGSGVAAGRLDEGVATLSLSPATPDDAVVLDGTLGDGRFIGTWTWFEAGAPVAQGIFLAERATEGERGAAF